MTTVYFEGTKEPYHLICDVCDEVPHTKSVNFKSKDFTICFNCLSNLANRCLTPVFAVPSPIKTQRKTISEELRAEILEKYNYKCAFCGSEKNLQLDHIIPFSHGGQTTKDNLQVLCRSCNSKKGNRQ